MYLDNPHWAADAAFSIQPRTGPSLPVNKISEGYLQPLRRAGLWLDAVSAGNTLSEGAPGGANRAESGGQEFLEACKPRRHAADTSDAQEGGFEEKNVKNPGDAFINNAKLS